MVSDSEPLHQRRFVRVRERHNGFVEFDFSIGDPELYVELILTDAAFDEFCTTNRVKLLGADGVEQIDRYRDTWVKPHTDNNDVTEPES
ncbi:phenol hydroxylase subunit [Thiosocius teredinicola]|uniref:phenol hydroxylase subunit n=1 Tax=Thiosocius teredinicola TaxID=1973002 RepID=UPI000990C4EA